MKIGWFFNPQGAGHKNRLATLVPHFSSTTQLATLSYAGCTLSRDLSLGRRDPIPHLTLPAYNTPTRHSYLRDQVWQAFHGLQMNSGGNAPFFAMLTAWIADWQPDLMVIDVALETALAARLCGIPVIYMRQHGKRWDLGHKVAYEASLALLAPFSSDMEQTDCPGWIKKKTFYSGGFCRFDPRQTPPSPFVSQADRSRQTVNVVVMLGAGGTNISYPNIFSAAAATPHWQWVILGQPEASPDRSNIEPGAVSPNIRLLGKVCDVYPYLRHADLVVANAGHNAVMEIGAARAPFFCWPAQRPFKEQLCKAATLEALDLAVVRHRWPQPQDWPMILTAANRKSRTQWQRLLDVEAPQRAARFIESVGRRCLPAVAA
ncbi:MAG: hypothetical protein AAGF01_19785 [Cyanobacteria bacterium P01_G01_bin.38]